MNTMPNSEAGNCGKSGGAERHWWLIIPEDASLLLAWQVSCGDMIFGCGSKIIVALDEQRGLLPIISGLRLLCPVCGMSLERDGVLFVE